MVIVDRVRRVMPAIVASGLVLAAVLVLAEGVVRYLGWHPPQSYTNIRYENDPMAGPWAMPSQVGFFQSPCFEIKDIRINSFGMRDRERRLAKLEKRVALVGDSMTQGLQVRDDATVSRRLEGLFGGRVEVLNFGVSSTGTSVELLLYRKRVRPFRPDVVLLMFYVGNDVVDNLPALKLRHDPAMAIISPYLLLDSDERLKAAPEPGGLRRTSSVHGLLGYSALGRWAYHVYTGLKIRSIIRSSGVSHMKSNVRIDLKAETELYEEAWKITKQVLLRFREEVHRDKGRFGLVVIPSGIESLGRTGLINSETESAVAYLRILAQQARFPILDLSLAFQALVRSEGPTEFSYPCDGHWNSRGHAEAANAIHKFLMTQGWL